MEQSITIDILRGYRINYYTVIPYENGPRYFIEWTAYREDNYLNSVRKLIDFFNDHSIDLETSKTFIFWIKKFI